MKEVTIDDIGQFFSQPCPNCGWAKNIPLDPETGWCLDCVNKTPEFDELKLCETCKIALAQLTEDFGLLVSTGNFEYRRRA